MTNKKKITLGLIAALAVSAPIVTAVSCGKASKDADNIDVRKAAAYLKNGLFVDSEDYVPIKSKGNIKMEDFLNLSSAEQKAKLAAHYTVDVKDDVAVLAGGYYTGDIQDISTIYNKSHSGQYAKFKSDKTYTTEYKHFKNGSVLPQAKSASYSTPRSVVEVGKGDSMIYFFDKDAKDGKDMTTFKHNFVLLDSSIAGMGNKGNIITDLNKLIGLRGITSWGQTSYEAVPFVGNLNKGVSISYYGSQNNHTNPKRQLRFQSGTNTKIEWEKNIKRLRGIYPSKVVDKIVNYYKTASKLFKPTDIPFGYIKYELIGPNAMQVSFSSEPNVTAAHFGWMSKDGSKVSWDAELSIGGKSEWAAYNNGEGDQYLIMGKHKTK